MEALGRAVSARRGELNGMTQRQLADRTGLAIDTVQMIEKGTRTRLHSKTRTTLEDALEWPRGMVDQILRTGKVPSRRRGTPAGATPRDAIVAMSTDEENWVTSLLTEATGNPAVVRAWILGVQKIKDEMSGTRAGTARDVL